MYMDLTDSIEAITPQQFHGMSGVDDWRVIGEGVCAYFRTGSLVAGAGLVQAISEMLRDSDVRPDIDVRHDGVAVRLFVTPDLGLSQRDVGMAQKVSAVARKLGLPADPSAVQTVQVSIDALARPAVTPFWRAVLGWVERDGPEDLMDPRGRGPAFYFQQMDAPRMQRNRIHIDVYVPYDQAEARITAALAAGGHMVTDKFAPHWWVLADPEGNEACVATFGWIGPVPRF
jgi:4a-hydroxytetrahydrobiopterin dehydratase